MSTFTVFPDLPTELRLIIWEIALEDDAPNRLVFIHRGTLRPVPLRCLVSPFLSVSHETRELALKRYHLRLDVLRLPAIEANSVFQRHFRGSGITWSDVYRTLPSGGHTTSDVEWLFREGLEHAGVKKGALYLSPDEDRFMPFHQWCAAHVHDHHGACSAPFNGSRGPRTTRGSRGRARCTHNVRYDYVCGKLPQEARERVDKVVHFHERCPLAVSVSRLVEQSRYPVAAAAQNWMKDEFSKMAGPTSKHLVLDALTLGHCEFNFNCNNLPSLILEVSKKGAAHLGIEEWQMAAYGGGNELFVYPVGFEFRRLAYHDLAREAGC